IKAIVGLTPRNVPGSRSTMRSVFSVRVSVCTLVDGAGCIAGGCDCGVLLLGALLSGAGAAGFGSEGEAAGGAGAVGCCALASKARPPLRSEVRSKVRQSPIVELRFMSASSFVARGGNGNASDIPRKIGHLRRCATPVRHFHPGRGYPARACRPVSASRRGGGCPAP